VFKNNNPFELTGRVAVVTGSGSGLGKAIALGFSQFGATIVSADLQAGSATATAVQVQSAGGEAVAFQLDATDDAVVKQFVSNVVAKFGRIDILVNSAGVSSHCPSEAMTIQEWTRVMDVNLTGTFLCCRTVGAVMVQQGKGSIINITSIGGMVGMGRGTAAYGASKGGVVMLTRELAVEWGSKNVRVNGIAPCQFRTSMLEAVLKDPQYDPKQLMQNWVNNIPLNRIGETDEIVGPAVFLASDASSMVTGHILAVDGGYLAR
jgi:NAD(P)-dependent dehydrogenase (short-subunit alcohol dehydrogenase family)